MSGLNLVKIVVEISEKFEGLEDDFLVAKFLDMELVEVVHCQVEKALSIRTSHNHVDRIVKAGFMMKMMMLMIGYEDGEWAEGLVWEEDQQWSELAATCNMGNSHWEQHNTFNIVKSRNT